MHCLCQREQVWEIWICMAYARDKVHEYFDYAMSDII